MHASAEATLMIIQLTEAPVLPACRVINIQRPPRQEGLERQRQSGMPSERPPASRRGR